MYKIVRDSALDIWQFAATLDWATWLYGLGAAVITGGASGVTAAIGTQFIDPQHFSSSTPGFYRLMWGLFAVNGTLGLIMYLRQSPLPKRIGATEQATPEPQQKA